MSDRTDEETAELVKAWIRRYGMTILAGVVIALAAVFALNRWQEHQRGKGYARSERLARLQSAVAQQQLATAEKLYAGLQEDDTIHASMAALLMAKLYHDKKDDAAAAKALQSAAKSKDGLLAQAARWSLAQLQVDAGEYDAALATLALLRGSAYDGELGRVQGDIFLLQKKPRQALDAYRSSQKIQPTPLTRLRIDELQARLAGDRETPVSSRSDDRPSAEGS